MYDFLWKMMWTILKLMGLNNPNRWCCSLTHNSNLWLIRVASEFWSKLLKMYFSNEKNNNFIIILQAVYHKSVITSSLSFSTAKTVMFQSITLSTEDYSILYEAPQLVLILRHQSFCKRRRPSFFNALYLSLQQNLFMASCVPGKQLRDDCRRLHHSC